MIRDPSDGSVRKNWVVGPTINDERLRGTSVSTNSGPVIDTTTSGLQTGSGKQSEIDRLKKWRAWLHQYHANKNKPTFDPET